MTAIFRSEEMYLCEVYMPVETCYSILAALGEQRIVQFRDKNIDFKKGWLFKNEVQMCEDLEGKIHYLRLQTKDYNVKVRSTIGNPAAPHPRQIIDLEVPGTADFDLLRKLYSEVKQISYNLSPLERTVKLHTEYQAILKTACNLLFQRVVSLSDTELGKDFNVHIIGGVLPKSKWNGFEKTLWRICHGNYVLQASDIPSGVNEERMLFVLLVHGSLLKEKILKLCQSFSADMYDIPENRARCSFLSMRNKSIIADLKKTVATSKEHYTKLLLMVATNLYRWLVEVKKMKSIYHTMNHFKLEKSETFFIAECWVPKNSFETFRQILFDETKKAGCDLQPMVFPVEPKNENRPTYFRHNKFTKSFQNIIDAYGIANYKELNPMPYTVITFPFLFAVMFGDAGHALILIIIGSLMIAYEKRLEGVNSEIFKMIYGGRYIIILMGLFSLYTGCIYNDVFGYYFKLFGSSWKIESHVLNYLRNSTAHDVTLEPKTSFSGTPYYFGLDPIWRAADNEIRITNSLKMKMSIILGVVHMMFGISLSLLNMIYFKDYVSIFTEFIPQLVFFGALFAYFACLIFIKWLSYGASFPSERSPYCAPSIIITFVNMVLPNKKEDLPGCADKMYPYQGTVQSVCFYAAVLCVPVMLIIKPAYYISKGLPAPERNCLRPEPPPMEKLPSQTMAKEKRLVSDQSKKNKKAKFSGRGDLIIHQIIHTIEFVLGTVSYTASYLRLWALSLAHANLTHVLDIMIWNISIYHSTKLPSIVGGILIALIFFAWASCTVAILIIMEGLSAFLHALRLHWMEFQTKFYVGQGYPFTPFSFKGVFREATRELS